MHVEPSEQTSVDKTHCLENIIRKKLSMRTHFNSQLSSHGGLCRSVHQSMSYVFDVLLYFIEKKNTETKFLFIFGYSIANMQIIFILKIQSHSNQSRESNEQTMMMMMKKLKNSN